MVRKNGFDFISFDNINSTVTSPFLTKPISASSSFFEPQYLNVDQTHGLAACSQCQMKCAERECKDDIINAGNRIT